MFSVFSEQLHVESASSWFLFLSINPRFDTLSLKCITLLRLQSTHFTSHFSYYPLIASLTYSPIFLIAFPARHQTELILQVVRLTSTTYMATVHVHAVITKGE